METKICKRCDEEKNISEFPHKKNYCRLCQNWFCRDYKRRNREKISAYNKEYKGDHKDEICDYNADYSIKNRDQIQKRQTAQHRERKLVDKNYDLACKYRTYLNSFLKNKSKAFEKYLGCDHKTFLDWLKFNFDDNMTLENYGEVWHLDHVIPVSYFDLTDENKILECFNWSNIRPLHKLANQKRVNHLKEEEYLEHRIKVDKFIDEYEFNCECSLIEYDIKEFIRNKT